jgi:cyclic-di-AMP phosphodiesterase PgpH
MKMSGIEENRIRSLSKWLAEGGLKRFTLFLTFVLLLTFFFHFREQPRENVEIGKCAKRYVLAEIDFNFPDEEATQVLKQEAVKDIGPTYYIEEMQAKRLRFTVEKSLIDDHSWRLELPHTAYEEIDTILDAIENQLSTARFSSKRTLSRIKKLDLPINDLYAVKADSVTDLLSLPEDFWEDVVKSLSLREEIHPETAAYLIKLFSAHSWNISQDYVFERKIRETVQNQIPQKYSHVDAGSHIIKRGEIVAPRHVMMLTHMAHALAKAKRPWSFSVLLGSFSLSLCITWIGYFYLRVFNPKLLYDTRKMLLLVIILIFTALFAKGVEYMLLYECKHIDAVRFPLFVPLATLLIAVLIDCRIAFVSSLLLILFLETTLAVDSRPFFLINFLASIATIFFARKLHKRKEVFSLLGKVWLTTIPLILAFNLSQSSHHVFFDLASSFLFLAVTSVIAIGLLPLFEVIFHVMTDMMLMEYMDPNNELLRRLSLEAPGTYQHCLVVGNIAEAGARAIKANTLFCRVSTLYHDIGKLFNPHYFTENQLGGFNIHQLLTPEESTHVIITHVAEGEALARKFRLPQSFIDIISEHHGTTMVYYFYCKQVEQAGGDPMKVNEKSFRYAGPKPRSKESGIIMIADTVEAASRSMDNPTEEGIKQMVDQLVDEKIEDGQFDECQLTFDEIGRVKKAIVRALMVTRHLRIKYPERF